MAEQNREEFAASLITKAWQDENFKKELMSNPKAVIQRETGQEVPDGIKVTILEETPNQVYFVIPNKPNVDSSEELSDEALEAVAGGGAIFGKKKKGWYFVTD
ncbi:MAG: NHLP leader peptide family RiPP precursor [Cyanobacteria bacterium P01_A01_bin.84]